MSDLQGGDSTVRADDDTSAGAITQGGHTARRGNSIVWMVAALIVIAAITLAWLTERRPTAPAERGTSPISTSAGAQGAGPSSR